MNGKRNTFYIVMLAIVVCITLVVCLMINSQDDSTVVENGTEMTTNDTSTDISLQAELVTQTADITFEQKEIDEAIKAAETYFQEMATDRILKRIWFNEVVCVNVLSSYMQSGPGRTNSIKEENVIVLLCDFEIKNDSTFAGKYVSWQLIFIRKDCESPWILDGEGV